MKYADNQALMEDLNAYQEARRQLESAWRRRRNVATQIADHLDSDGGEDHLEALKLAYRAIRDECAVAAQREDELVLRLEIPDEGRTALVVTDTINR